MVLLVALKLTWPHRSKNLKLSNYLLYVFPTWRIQNRAAFNFHECYDEHLKLNFLYLISNRLFYAGMQIRSSMDPIS